MSPSFPKNQLDRLRRQIQIADARTITWNRARKPTIDRLQVSDQQAVAYIVDTVQLLTEGHFVETVMQRGSWFDVYGIYRDGYGWFVKIGEDDDGCIVLSHHEPECGSLETRTCGTIYPIDPTAAES